MAKKKSTKKIVAATEKLSPPIPSVELKTEIDDGEYIGRRGLTLMQARFVKYYVGEAGGNATKAAELAGYSAANRNTIKVIAHKVLYLPNVQRAVFLAEGGVTRKEIRDTVGAIARGSIGDGLSVNEDGKVTFDLLTMMKNGSVGQIKKATFNPEGECIGIELYNKVATLTLAAKLKGMLTEKHDITSGGKPIKAFLDIDDGDAPATPTT